MAPWLCCGWVCGAVSSAKMDVASAGSCVTDKQCLSRGLAVFCACVVRRITQPPAPAFLSVFFLFVPSLFPLPFIVLSLLCIAPSLSLPNPPFSSAPPLFGPQPRPTEPLTTGKFPYRESVLKKPRRESEPRSPSGPVLAPFSCPPTAASANRTSRQPTRRQAGTRPRPSCPAPSRLPRNKANQRAEHDHRPRPSLLGMRV